MYRQNCFRTLVFTFIGLKLQRIRTKNTGRLLLMQAMIAVLAVGACKSEGDRTLHNAIASNPPFKVMPSNDEIMMAVYDTAYSVPANFFVDERANTVQSYSIYHVKDSSNSYELCADDVSEALAWEEADNSARAVNGTFVGTYENANYFEVIRELSFPDDIGNVGATTSPGFSRIFKCEHVDRNGVDRNLRNGYGGTLNTRPLNASVVREFAEYLWQFVFFDASRRIVLDTNTVERQNSFDHSMLLAIVLNQGFDQCDRIEIVDWLFSTDKLTGEVTRKFQFLYAFEAQLATGSPSQC